MENGDIVLRVRSSDEGVFGRTGKTFRGFQAFLDDDYRDQLVSVLSDRVRWSENARSNRIVIHRRMVRRQKTILQALSFIFKLADAWHWRWQWRVCLNPVNTGWHWTAWTKDVPELLALVFELAFDFIYPLHRKGEASRGLMLSGQIELDFTRAHPKINHR